LQKWVVYAAKQVQYQINHKGQKEFLLYNEIRLFLIISKDLAYKNKYKTIARKMEKKRRSKKTRLS